MTPCCFLFQSPMTGNVLLSYIRQANHLVSFYKFRVVSEDIHRNTPRIPVRQYLRKLNRFVIKCFLQFFVSIKIANYFHLLFKISSIFVTTTGNITLTSILYGCSSTSEPRIKHIPLLTHGCIPKPCS